MSKKLLVAAALTCLLGTPASATAIAVFGPGPLDVVALSAQALVFNFTDMPDVGGTRGLSALPGVGRDGDYWQRPQRLAVRNLNAPAHPSLRIQTGPATFPVLRDFGAIRPAASRCKPPAIVQCLFPSSLRATSSTRPVLFTRTGLSCRFRQPSHSPQPYLSSPGLVGLGWLSRRRRKQLQAG